MKTCAIIPAAGRGSRLKTNTPKLLSSLTHDQTVWSILRQKLMIVDHIHVVASPNGEPLIRQVMQQDISSGFASISVQAEPNGMGDAIFQCYPIWSQAETILIVWGDQVFVSEDTFMRSLKTHAGVPKTIALPLSVVTAPYVEYSFDVNSRLIDIKQSREGDSCAAVGLADVGTFVLSVSDLLHEWYAYLKQVKQGSRTNEINFLPFLPFLSANGWRVHRVEVTNPVETRGINTPDDLLFFQNLYENLTL